LSLNSFLQPQKQVAVEELVEELELEQEDEHGDILGSSAAQRHSACNVEANLNSALQLLGHHIGPFLPPHGYTHSTHHLHSLPSTTAAHHHWRRHHHKYVGIPTEKKLIYLGKFMLGRSSCEKQVYSCLKIVPIGLQNLFSTT
jgi:hypothetical protein